MGVEMTYADKLDAEFMWSDRKLTKLVWIGENVFDFTTYEYVILDKWAGQMIDVIENILNGTTFEYYEKNEEVYLMMVNMPFLVPHLEWGTSIRGAWIDEYTRDFNVVGLQETVPKKDIKLFLSELIKWSRI